MHNVVGGLYIVLNINKNGLMFILCILDVAEMTNTMHWLVQPVHSVGHFYYIIIRMITGLLYEADPINVM
jgi:hypothetical protein